MLKDIQYHLHFAIPEMEKAYLHTSLRSTKLIIAIHEMKMLRIQEYFEYKNAKCILKRNVLYTT
ncbi:hypothetical protein H5410_028368 [Solanum commersonii]|uniref:Uncharacterized protein n=1 Tax=Solanum commersonii TaxID=4109 RepID=A0A9J5Z5Y6_SOLCO|nr:hypothetical protein H5410_028368 [Solanum commersonii]